MKKRNDKKVFLIFILLIVIAFVISNSGMILGLPAAGYLGGPCVPGGPSPLDPPDCLESCTICVNNVCVHDPLCGCTPQDISVTCAGISCGTRQDNCGNPVSCGTCDDNNPCTDNICSNGALRANYFIFLK